MNNEMKTKFIISVFLQLLFAANVSSYAQSTLQELFAGNTSGVYVSSSNGNPNGMFDISVRGVNSLRTDGNPIWIVDGVILNSVNTQNLNAFMGYETIGNVSALNAVNFLSAAQVEKIEVLKSASATSQYGSLGANGVVLIKTKRGSGDGLNFDWNTRIDAGNKYFRQEHTAFLSNSDGRKTYGISAFFNNSIINRPRCGDNIGGFKVNFETRANNVIWFGVNSLIGLGKIDSANSSPYYGSTYFQSDFSDVANDIRNVTSAYLLFNVLPYLNINLECGSDFYNQSRFIWYGKGTDFGQKYDGAAGRLGNNFLSYNGRLSVNFSRYITDKHKLEASLGLFVNGGIRKYSRSCGTGYAIPDLSAKGISMATSKDNPYDFDLSCCTLGAEMRAKYSFQEMLTLSATLISDNTPKYDNFQSFNFYPSASVSFDFHNAFFSSSKSVSTLSIETGFGKSGREYYIPTESFPEFSNAPIPDIRYDRAIYYDALNRMRTTQWDALARIGFASDILVLGIGWYDKSTSDALIFYDKSNTLKEGVDLLEYGDRKEFSSLDSKIVNKGFELDVDLNYAKKTWSMGVAVRSAYNVNQILKVDREELYAPKTCGLQTSINTYGQSVGTFVGYKVDEKGQFVDLNHDGNISDADKIIIGSPIPLFNGSFSLNASYKGLSFNAQFIGAAGFDILNINEMLADKAQNVCSKYVQKGDYLRLSKVDVNYRFANNSIKWIKEASVIIGLRNVLTLSSYGGLNPSVNCWPEHGFSRGLDYGSYPVYKTVMVGFNIKF